MDNLTNALTTAFSTISADLLGVLAAVVPIALGIVGAGMLVRYGFNAFRTLSKAKTVS